MGKEFWTSAWINRQINFHKSKINRHLIKYGHLLKNLDVPKKNILVPLCGKSLDMNWFKEAGHNVYGVEIVEEAILNYFNELNQKYSLQTRKSFNKYSSHRITLYCADFLQISPKLIPPINVIYDRASLVALPYKIRLDYYKKLDSFLERGGEIFLICLEYQSKTELGPPYSVSEEEIRKEFSNFKINLIYSDSDINHSNQKIINAKIKITEKVYILSKETYLVTRV